MRLLVANDDGIDAPGLRALVRALRDLGQMTVVAPDREQSGVGASFSLHHPIRIRRLRTRGVRTYAVEGTPGDAVILALGYLCPEGVDVVVAGINQGSNMGNDLLLSGTIGAALQGHFRGIPSLAISVAALKRVRYRTAARVARALVPLVAGQELFRHTFLNVTVPNVAADRVQGVEITRLGTRTYADEVRQENDGRRAYFWIARSKPDWDIQEGTDVWAVKNKRISITPVHSDLTAYGAVEALTGHRRMVAQALGLGPA